MKTGELFLNQVTNGNIFLEKFVLFMESLPRVGDGQILPCDNARVGVAWSGVR